MRCTTRPAVTPLGAPRRVRHHGPMRLPHRIATTIALGALTLVAAGCGDDSSNQGADDGSLLGLLGEVPASAVDGAEAVEIIFGDLEAATAGAGLERPDPADATAVRDWSAVITGVMSPVEPEFRFVIPGDSLTPTSWVRLDEMRAELGWTVGDLDQFVDVAALPSRFMVATVREGVEDSIGDAIGDADDGIWFLGGEDFAVDVAGSTAARPIGESLRIAAGDGLLAVSRSTPPLAEWIDGPEESLADDEGLAAVAGALDDAGAYTAMILDGTDHSIAGALGATAGPERTAAILDELGDGLPEPFGTVGYGLSTDDDAVTTATIVYRFASEEAATDGAERIGALITDGTSFVTRAPVSERLTLIDATADGQLVIVTVGFVDTAPHALLGMLLQRDLPFVHR